MPTTRCGKPRSSRDCSANKRCLLLSHARQALAGFLIPGTPAVPISTGLYARIRRHNLWLTLCLLTQTDELAMHLRSTISNDLDCHTTDVRDAIAFYLAPQPSLSTV